MTLNCPACDSQHIYDTGCAAENCPGHGFCCIDCAWGCTQLEPDGGACEASLTAEGREATHERLNDEREALGLSQLPFPREPEE